MKVVVVGCGYVGLVSGVGLASVGHEVVGVEVSDERRRAIAAGEPPFHEPGLTELLRETLAGGRFRVAGDMEEVAEAEVVLLAVQTPPAPDGSNDVTFLRRAAEAVAEAVRSARDGERVVAVRSTVVPGTVDRVVRPAVGELAAVASNPEFLREGSAVADFLEPDRVVIGCNEPSGRELLGRLYEPLGAEIVFTSPATAELSKYASNAFLATLISFSNEIGRIAETLPGVDVEDVLQILHRDRRLSPRIDGGVVRPGILSYLKAGVGYGGSCLPKDLSALIATRDDAAPLLAAVRAVNETQPVRLVERAAEALDGLAGRSVTVLGLAFKGGTDDLRDSPGLRVVELLLQRGARVRAFDPLVVAEAVPDLVGRGVAVCETLADALAESECCVVTTNAPEFEELPSLLARRPGAPLVVDGRRALAAGVFDGPFIAVGRGPA